MICGCAECAEVMMETDTFQFHRFPVQGKSVLIVKGHPAITKAGIDTVLYRSLFIEHFRAADIQIRIVHRPERRMVHRQSLSDGFRSVFFQRNRPAFRFTDHLSCTVKNRCAYGNDMRFRIVISDRHFNRSFCMIGIFRKIRCLDMNAVTGNILFFRNGQFYIPVNTASRIPAA